MNPFKLVFGNSVYKQSLNEYEFFLRTNRWANVGKGVLVVILTSLIFNFFFDGVESKAIPSEAIAYVFIISLAIYKIVVSAIRYFKKKFPVYGSETTHSYTSDRRFKTGRRVSGSTTMLNSNYDKPIKAEDLDRHKSEQLAKMIYHLIIAVVFIVLVTQLSFSQVITE